MFHAEGQLVVSEADLVPLAEFAKALGTGSASKSKAKDSDGPPASSSFTIDPQGGGKVPVVCQVHG
eukprot:2867631-Lingulodinium_polyedra.AAC.1